jgi:hypothetical protein
MKKFFVTLFVVMAIATTTQAQLNDASRSKNLVTTERMIYHVLVDGPKDFEEYGWTVTFSKTKSSTSTDDVSWDEYLVHVKKKGASPNTYIVRETWGINAKDGSYEHTIGVKVFPHYED